jgi:hypothetical protein
MIFKISKTYLINVAIAFALLTIIHWIFQALWYSEGSPFFRLILAGAFAYFNPLYKPKDQE